MPRSLGQEDAKTILFFLNMARGWLRPKKLGEDHFSATFGSLEFRVIFEPRSLYYDNGWKEGSGYCLSKYSGGELEGSTPRLLNYPEMQEIFDLLRGLAAN
jgi:hypothetical protein